MVTRPLPECAIRPTQSARIAPTSNDESALVTDAHTSAQLASLEAEPMRVRARQVELRTHSKAANTRRAYDSDWRALAAWCDRLAAVEPTLIALPASDQTLSYYIASLAERSPSTVRRALAAIRFMHEQSGYPMLLEERPQAAATLAGLTRKAAGTPKRQASAATDAHIRAMADTCDTSTLIGLRDRALLLVGFDTALRRSELVGIDVAHLVSQTGTGITVHLPHAKTDQSGKGAMVAMRERPGSPWCPVEALQRWLSASGRDEGAVFVALHTSRHCLQTGTQRLSDRSLSRIIKAATKQAGLQGDFSGHSLRRGAATTALQSGASLQSVQRHLRHRSLDTTLGYVQADQALEAHPHTGLQATVE